MEWSKDDKINLKKGNVKFAVIKGVTVSYYKLHPVLRGGGKQRRRERGGTNLSGASKNAVTALDSSCDKIKPGIDKEGIPEFNQGTIDEGVWRE